MMHKARTLLIAVCAVALLGAGATALAAPATQPGGGRGGDRNSNPRGALLFGRINAVAAELNLSASQTAQIKGILDRARQDFAAMQPDLETMDPRDRAEHVRDLVTGVQSDITKQLDPDQAKAFEQKIDALRDWMKARLRAQAGAAATTQPGTAARAGAGEAAGTTREARRPGEARDARRAGEARGGMMLERLKENLDALQLNDQQRAKVSQLLEDLKTRAAAIRQEATGAGADVRDKVRALMQESRTRLAAILTPEQLQKLRERMSTPRGDRPRGNAPRGDGTRGATTRPKGVQREGPRADAGEMRSEMMAGQDMTAEANKGEMTSEMSGEMKGAAKSSGAAAHRTEPGARPRSASESAAAMAVPAIGAAAPELALPKLDGTLVQLSALRGHVIVLEFGSYSSPSFRRRAPAMEQLKREYGIRAQFYIVYTREAHPAGGWEVDRNKDQDIRIAQPASPDARRLTAQAARDKLKLTVPILLDTTDDAAAAKFAATQNSAIVIDRDGRLAARQEWFEPVALRRHIDAAIAAPKSAVATTRPAVPSQR